MATDNYGDLPEDPLPAMLADIDQGLAMLPHWAKVVHSQYEALRSEGFTPHHALYYLALKDRSDTKPEE